MIYLYVFLDGRETKQCSNPPTEADLEAVDQGELEVLRIGGGPVVETYNCGQWEPTPEAEIESTHGVSWHA